jgi:hypothetical protein
MSKTGEGHMQMKLPKSLVTRFVQQHRHSTTASFTHATTCAQRNVTPKKGLEGQAYLPAPRMPQAQT